MRTSAVVALLLATVALAAPEEKSANPFVMVTKSVSQNEVVIGTPLTVTVTAKNIGQQPAYNVQLVDPSPSADGPVYLQSADKLAFGENVTVTYTFTPTELGPAAIGNAEVTYSPSAGEEATLKSLSNFVREELDFYRGEADTTPAARGSVMVLTQEQYDRIHSKKILEMLSYLILAFVPVVIPYLLFKSKLAQIDALFREAKKRI